MKSFYNSIVFLILSLFSQVVFAQQTLNKEIKQTHSLSNDGALYLENKYGNIYLNGWKKDVIDISINIEAKGRNKVKAQELLDRIKPNIIVTNKQIIIKSDILKNSNGFFNKYMDKIGPFMGEKSNMVINYTIYVPENVALDIYNKYGDVFITSCSGKLKANIEYGNLNSKETLDNSKINIKHGRLYVETITSSTIIAKDAVLSIVFGKDLKINSNGSEIDIDTMEGLDITSNKDKIVINRINGAFGSIKYATVLFRTVENKINLDLNLAELRLLKLNTIPNINISQNKSEVYLNISETNFSFNARLEQGVLRIPKTMENIESHLLDKKTKLRQISASYGGVRIGNIAFTGIKGVIILKEL